MAKYQRIYLFPLKVRSIIPQNQSGLLDQSDTMGLARCSTVHYFPPNGTNQSYKYIFILNVVCICVSMNFTYIYLRLATRLMRPTKIVVLSKVTFKVEV